ncbi:MAG TPA: serine/threonine-protein kinase, partial [Polyangiaceae bacterium]|nr:serine/threonine-protein kinase [Polyangiaceae bacterium]
IAVNIVGQACKGLHAAHDLGDEHGAPLGVVHRDISPQNVLVTYSGTTKLVDFGIAKATARASTLTEAGEVKGKFAYMSPEQVSGGAIDRRSDIFAMGVLLYMLTTGRHPFKGEHAGETVRNICSDEPALPPTSFLPEYPSGLESVLLQSESKSPDDRWSTATDMLAALEEAMPDCLEGSFEVKVSEYLNELMGHRSGERRKQLRLAEERADRGRTELPLQQTTGSYGSLGAVYIDRSGSNSSRSSQLMLAACQPTSPEPASVPARAPRFGKRALVVAALLVGGPILAFSLQQATQERTSGQASAAASPVPPATLSTRPSISDLPVIITSGAVEMAAPSAKPEAEKLSDALRGKAARRPAAAPARAGNPERPPAAAAPAAPAAAPVVPQAAAKPAANIAPSSNAWDTSNFGGRR